MQYQVPTNQFPNTQKVNMTGMIDNLDSSHIDFNNDDADMSNNTITNLNQ